MQEIVQCDYNETSIIQKEVVVVVYSAMSLSASCALQVAETEEDEDVETSDTSNDTQITPLVGSRPSKL